jgi:DNA-binding response OmpR family regulator
LLKNNGIVLTRAQIESHIFDSLADPVSNVVDVTVAGIRKKLRAAGAANILQTRRGHGYSVRESS